MLGWLISAVAPWLIHLWRRRRYRRTPWAAMEYLLAALEETRRRLRLEEWTLLVVRTALIVLVVLALAEPFHTPQLLAHLAGQRVHRILVLDASLSMGYKQADKSRWEQAKQWAAEIITHSAAGDAFSLILMADPPQIVVGPPVLDRQEMVRELEEVRLRHTSADLPATLACIEQVVQEASQHLPRMDRTEVYFLTDLCRVGWTPAFAHPEAKAAWEQRLMRLAQKVRLTVVDLGQPGASNVALTELRLLEPYTATGQPLHVEAVLKSFGQPQPAQPVELWVNGQLGKKTTVNLPADGTVSVVLECLADTPGEYRLEVRSWGDRLEEDNRRFAVRKVQSVFRVLCVDGRPSGGREGSFQGAADFLALALQPDPQSSSALPLQPEIVPETALSERPLSEYDCLFLCNVGQFIRPEVHLLRNYLALGGGIVFFLGDQVQAEAYNRLMADSPSSPNRILPARLGPLVSTSPGRLDPLDYRHPILSPFRGRERAGLLTTPIFRYFRLERMEGSQAQVVLAAANGDPLIVEEPVSRGRVILVATSADTSWTAMPLWPSYVPLVQELAAYAISGPGRQEQVRVGETLGAVLPASERIPSVRLTPPEGVPVELRPRGESGLLIWNYQETFWSGFYVADYGPLWSRQESYAVNPDTQESDLRKLSEAELREIWGPGVPFEYQTHWEASGPPVRTSAPPHRLTQLFLHTAIVLLVVESVLAWRMRNRRR